MNEEKMIELVAKKEYYSVTDLRYNKKLGIMMSGEQFTEFLDFKDRLVSELPKLMNPLPLRSFNSKHIFYANNLHMLSVYNEYLRIIVADLMTKQSLLFNRNIEDLIFSRFFSEIEGSLNIENVPTTRKRIAELHRKANPTDKNDVIIKNMIAAVEYIAKEKPEFNKENLRKLYSILSKDSLDAELCLKEGEYYRHDEVFIDSFEGAPPKLIDECMESLFSFANDPECIKKHSILLPYICHYYILYVHPYFDFNGRTARMVSFWLSYINDIAGAPLFMSEAINESKGDYYRALTNTRITNNDLTYFLIYILETSIKYSFIYKNLEEIKEELLKSGDTLTSTEWGYVKKILIHNPDSYFNHKMFSAYIHSKITKQGAIKILDNLTSYNILSKSKNRKNEIIYKFNQELITYRYN